MLVVHSNQINTYLPFIKPASQLSVQPDKKPAVGSEPIFGCNYHHTKLSISTRTL